MSDASRSELLADHSKLFDYLCEHIEDLQRELNEEMDFCNQDVESSMKYVELIEQKFQNQIQERKKQLNSIHNKNNELFQSYKDHLERVSDDISELHKTGQYSEALNKFEELQKDFQAREQMNRNMPKLSVNEGDIKQLFAHEQQPKPPSDQPSKPPLVQTAKPTVALSSSWDTGDDDTGNRKRDIRAKKEVEKAALNDDDKSVDKGKNDQEPEESNFGIRSRQAEKQPSPPQPSTTNRTIATGNPSPVPSVAPRSGFMFTRRLDPPNKKPNEPSSIRQHHTPPAAPSNLVVLQNGHAQRQPTPTRQQASPNQNNQPKPLSMNPGNLRASHP